MTEIFIRFNNSQYLNVVSPIPFFRSNRFGKKKTHSIPQLENYKLGELQILSITYQKS